MRIFLILIFLIIAISSCSKKEKTIKLPPSTEKEIVKVYQDGLEALKEGQYYIASEKFDQAESLLPQTKWAAKSALMSSYCLYSMSYYDEAILNLKRFTKIYPADPNIDYAYYLIAIIYYEQILDENLDIEPLLLSKKSIDIIRRKGDTLAKLCTHHYSVDQAEKAVKVLGREIVDGAEAVHVHIDATSTT